MEHGGPSLQDAHQLAAIVIDAERAVEQLAAAIGVAAEVSPEGVAIMQQPAAASSTGASKLRELKSLLDAGVITQSDYDNKKNEILTAYF